MSFVVPLLRGTSRIERDGWPADRHIAIGVVAKSNAKAYERSGFELGEVEPAIEDRRAGREDDLVGGQLRAVVEVHRRAAGLGGADDPVALVDRAAVLAQLARERDQDVERVELVLVGEDRAAVVGERHVELVVPPRVETQGAGRVVLVTRRIDLVDLCRVRDGVTGLDRHAVIGAEPHQPLLPLEVGVDVRLRDLRGTGCCRIVESLVPCSSESFAVVLPVVTAPTWRASMTATRRPARASSRRGRQARQAGADHEVVEALADRERVARGQVGAIEPQ